MKFRVTIDIDNDAFMDGELCIELQRLLHGVIHSLAYEEPNGKLFDANGNRVGQYGITRS